MLLANLARVALLAPGGVRWGICLGGQQMRRWQLVCNGNASPIARALTSTGPRRHGRFPPFTRDTPINTPELPTS